MRRTLPWIAATLLSACASQPPQSPALESPAAATAAETAAATATEQAQSTAQQDLLRDAVDAAAAPEPQADAKALQDQIARSFPPTPIPAILDQIEVREAPHIRNIDRTAATDDLWERIRRGFGMPDLDGPLVRAKVEWYVSRPDYLQRTFERSRKYLYYIVDELEKRGMPTELALLPMIESSFNPMAYSRAHASGLWQFIPPTGKRYSLQQTWWYDARRDVVASTDAALGYLEKLYDMLGDWQLALASYNWGENAVKRAIDRNLSAGLPIEYAQLSMPIETRQYIPKLQAMKNIISNPAAYGVVLDPIPNQPYFAAVPKPRAIDVQLAAKLAELPVAEFVALNPGFSRPLIPSSVDSPLILPADKVAVFNANLEKHDDSKLTSWQTYHPKRGESLEAVARKFKVSLARLKEVNGITRRNRGMPPQLVVPVTRSAAELRLPIMYAPPVQPSTRRVAYHIVRKGDTLRAVARRYRVTVADLQHWNPNLNFSEGQGVRLMVRNGGRRVKHARRSHGKPRSVVQARN
jgi:membrane-bound lytic murein transglycosylase D